MGHPKHAVRRVALSSLVLDDKNANKGTKRGKKMLSQSLEKYGAGRSVLLDRHGRIIAGNKTIEAARAAGMTSISVVETDGKSLIAVKRGDLDLKRDKKARELAIADNRTAEVSLDWDADVLESLDVDLSQFFNDSELKKLGLESEMQEVPAPKVDQAAALQKKWRTKRGQIWQVGAHRLMCGDATIQKEMDALMAGEKATLYSTDPPYLVDYDGNNRPPGTGKDWSATYHEVDIKDARAFLTSVFRNASASLSEAAAWYCWHAHKRAGLLEDVWREIGVINHQQIIWVKPSAVFGFAYYPWRHEPCLMGWRRGHKPKHDGENSHSVTSVWELDYDGKGRMVGNKHPTQKPLEIFAIPMRKHTQEKDLVLETFCGSGTQLCAAETLKRRCNAMEIEPAFVAVALERLADMGLKPKLCGNNGKNNGKEKTAPARARARQSREVAAGRIG